jgi:hypothetical protein
MYPPATTTSEDQAAVIGDRVVALAVDSYTSDKMYAYHKTRAYLGALSLVMSVRIEQLGSYWQISMKFDIWTICENMSAKY